MARLNIWHHVLIGRRFSLYGGKYKEDLFVIISVEAVENVVDSRNSNIYTVSINRFENILRPNLPKSVRCVF